MKITITGSRGDSLVQLARKASQIKDQSAHPVWIEHDGFRMLVSSAATESDQIVNQWHNLNAASQRGIRV